MRKRKCYLCILLICLLLNACNHNERESVNLNTEDTEPTITIVPEPTVAITPVAEVTSTPTPTVIVDKPEGGTEVTLTPTPVPTKEPELSPTTEPTLPPEPTTMPEPTTKPEPTKAPVVTPSTIPTVTPSPTPFPVSLGEAELINIVGSNLENSFSSQIIKNPLKLITDQTVLEKRLLSVIPSLNEYTRIETESYEWNYYKTKDEIPVVSLVRSISSEGKNNKEQTVYYAGMNYSSEISDEPSGVTIMFKEGYETTEEAEKLVKDTLDGILPEDLLRELLKKKGEANSTEQSGVSSHKLNYEGTPFSLDLRKEISENISGTENKGIKVSVTANRSKLLYSAYRDGLILHKQKFIEFPLDFSNFFSKLDPFHSFNSVKYTKQITYGNKTVTSYSAEFSGYDQDGLLVTIIVSMDNSQGEFSISGFRYYTLRDFTNDSQITHMETAADYYADYLNQIMTLATFKKDEFMNSMTGNRTSILKDVTVSGYTIPCKVTISEGAAKDETAFTCYLDIEYVRS